MSATSETTATPSALSQSNEHRSISASLQRQIIAGLIAAVGGVMIVAGGLVAYAIRVKLAVLLMDARVFFGIPVAEIDSLKILAVTLNALMVTGYGFVTIVAGCIVTINAHAKSRTA